MTFYVRACAGLTLVLAALASVRGHADQTTVMIVFAAVVALFVAELRAPAPAPQTRRRRSPARPTTRRTRRTTRRRKATR